MGRLEDIVDRNKNPRKHRKMRFPVGIMLSGFVLLVLVLIIFTDLDVGTSPPPPPAPDPNAEKRVDGVLLYRAPARRDAGSSDAAQPR